MVLAHHCYAIQFTSPNPEKLVRKFSKGLPILVFNTEWWVDHCTVTCSNVVSKKGKRMINFQSIEAVQEGLARNGYVCGRALATVVFLSLKLGRPLFLEGEAGVGKTEIAKTLAASLGRRLIRLQCYEGLDATSAVYEWNFAAQMIAIRTAGVPTVAIKTMIVCFEKPPQLVGDSITIPTKNLRTRMMMPHRTA